MSWEDILKRIEVLSESEAENKAKEQNQKWQSPEEKGYPVSNLKIIMDIDDDTDDLKGYTSFKDMGKFHFVGNSYIYPKHRGKGTFKQIMAYRNKNEVPIGEPKITLLNPIEGTTRDGLMREVAKNGGIEIKDYSMVDDIMSEKEYERLTANPNITMARYPPLKLMKWEETLKASKKKARRKKAKKNTKKYKAPKGVYTNPALRERIHARLLNKNTHGTPKGKWSARKSQELNRLYQKEGGGFVN